MFSKKPEITANLIKLKNGTEVAEQTVIMTMLCLEGIQNNAIALYELMEKCRNPKHKMYGNTRELVENCLISDGQIHDDVRNVILSAVESKGPFSFTISSPVAKNSFSNKM